MLTPCTLCLMVWFGTPDMGNWGVSMRVRFQIGWSALLCILSVVSLPPAALADDTEVNPRDFGSPTAPLPMVVILKQETLVTGRDPADGHEWGGGLVGGLVGSAFDSVVQGGAEKAFSPSRDIFTSAEAEQILMTAIRESVAEIDWIKMADGPALQDNSPDAKRALFQQNSASHVLAVDCSYNVSMRFEGVYAGCALDIIRRSALERQGKNNPKSLKKDIFYSRLVVAHVETANPAKSIGGRREQLIANSAILLRVQMIHALNNVGMLVGRQLQLTPDDIRKAKSNKQYKFFAAYVGMGFEHKGNILSGEENISCRFIPNAGGDSYQYRPDADGMVIYEKSGDLFYHWSIEEAGGPPMKPCR